jgi:hypothetical protein
MKVKTLSFGAVLLFAGSTLAQQPFANVQQSPTTSPYLNLLARQGSGLPAYQSLVKPQIAQQQENSRQQQQIQRLAGQQSKLAAGGGLTKPARGVSTNIRQTGHVSTSMDYLHYFQRPTPGSRPQ